MKTLKKEKETFEISSSITYNRINELETLLNEVQSKLDEMYLDEFKGQEKLSKCVNKSISNLWEMRRDYDVKKFTNL